MTTFAIITFLLLLAQTYWIYWQASQPIKRYICYFTLPGLESGWTFKLKATVISTNGYDEHIVELGDADDFRGPTTTPEHQSSDIPPIDS